VAISIKYVTIEDILKQGVETGFAPGQDNWQFPNEGSYLTAGGECAGMSVTSLWYYDEISSQNKGPSLYNLYTGRAPEIWQDDTPAYKLPVVVQNDYASFPSDISNSGKIIASDNITFNAFAVSMYYTNQPQLTSVSGIEKKTNNRVNHSMVAWKITENELYLVDPNEPEVSPVITINNGAFGVLDDPSVTWDIFYYRAKSSYVPWDKVAERWQEFYNGTIGNKLFPDYTLTVIDRNGKSYDLKDTLTVDTNLISLQVTGKASLKMALYRDDAWIEMLDTGQPQILQKWTGINLQQGDNLIGIWVMGNAGTTTKPDWEWVDIIYGTTTTTTTSTTVQPTGETDVTINTINSRFLGQDGSDYYYMVTVTGTASGPVGTGFATSVEVLAESGGYATNEGYGDIGYQTTWSGTEEGYNDRIRSTGDPATTTWTFSVPIRISAPWNGNIMVHVQLDTFSGNYGPGGLKTIKKSYTISGPG
jgi:hypothetical protein